MIIIMRKVKSFLRSFSWRCRFLSEENTATTFNGTNQRFPLRIWGEIGKSNGRQKKSAHRRTFTHWKQFMEADAQKWRTTTTKNLSFLMEDGEKITPKWKSVKKREKKGAANPHTSTQNRTKRFEMKDSPIVTLTKMFHHFPRMMCTYSGRCLMLVNLKVNGTMKTN